ncbi:MAG: radical SAM protein [Thermoguttaceae bacterium]
MLTKIHPRNFRDAKYVYPVVSRRSGGVSVGVNISPVCNFACLYCQVLGDPEGRGNMEPHLDVELLEQELRLVVALVESGELFEDEWFKKTPPEKRRFNDIALSGDGEPTLSSYFPEVVNRVVEVANGSITKPKIVLITNATMLHVKHIAQAVDFLMENRGELWTKLDAGTEEQYKIVSHSTVPFARVLRNISETAARHPVVIQTNFFMNHGSKPTESEVAAYCTRLREITHSGGLIKNVQLYTVARVTPDPDILPLENAEIDQIAEQVRKNTGLVVEMYYKS